jgi:predicted kinase
MGMSLCYKAYMRKWMRERMKRRQKPEEVATSEAKPAPLQPAYFDATSDSEPTEQAAEDKKQPSGTSASTSEEASDVDGNRENASSASDQPKRRRRKRGGRGRTSSRAPKQKPLAEQSESPEPAETGSVAATSVPVVPAPAATAPSVQTASAQRPSRGVVVLAIGLPGSGKSSWFKRHQITPLSSDLLRALLFDDATEQRFQDLVFSNLRSMLKARLIAKRPINYVDATNLTPQERSHWIKLAKDYGYEVHGVFFDVPLDVCVERNRRRQRTVDEGIMQRMASKLRAPTFDEGFAKITVVRVKKKDGEIS